MALSKPRTHEIWRPSSRFPSFLVKLSLVALAWLFCVFTPDSAAAQFGEARLATVSYEYHPTVGFQGDDRGFHVARAGFIIPPLVLKKDTTFILGSTRFEQVRPTTESDVFGGLRSAVFSVTGIHRPSEKWTLILGGGLGLASDFAGDVTSDDIIYNGTAMAMYTWLPELTLGAGVIYDRRTGTLLPVPLAIIYWEPIHNFSIRGTAPAALYVSWRPIESLTTLATASLEGQRFHLSGDDYKDQQGSLAYSLIKVGAGARVHFGEYVHLELLAGLLMRRRFELFVGGDSQGKASIPPGPFVGLSLWIGRSGWSTAFDAPNVD